MKKEARVLVLAAVAVIGLACSFISGTSGPIETAIPAATFTRTHTETILPAETATSSPETSPTPIPLYWRELQSAGDLPRDPVSAFVANPEDPEVLYAGTQHAGVYKSYDAGKTWRPVRQGIGNATISRLLIDPSDPQTLYASTGSPQTGSGYTYKTTDGGGNWQKLATFGPGGSLIMDGADPRRLYFQIEDRIDVSEDGGRTWTKMPALPALIWDIYAHPSAANVLFATPGPNTEGFFRSEDGGRTWKKIELKEFHLLPILVGTDPAGREVMFTEALWDGQLFVSSDDGETWKEIMTDCGTVAIDHKSPTTIYCAAEYSLKYSSDAGASWKSKPHPGGKLNFLGLSGGGSGLFISGFKGLFFSPDAGTMWKEMKNGLGGIWISLQSDSSSRNLYAEDAFCNVFHQSSGEDGWDLIHTNACVLSIGYGGELYLGYGGGSVDHSSNEGRSWSSLTPPWSKPIRTQVIASPRDKNRLWAISTWPDFFFSRSQDGGRTWIPVPESEAPQSGMFLFPPAPSRRIYELGRGPGMVSEDDGETWRQCGADFPGATTAVLDPDNPDVIYAASRSEGLFISQNGCNTWIKQEFLSERLFIESLAVDPEHAGRLYAGTGSGAYVSVDSGETWTAINDGLPPDPIVYSIVVDFDGRILAATPEGFYLLNER